MADAGQTEGDKGGSTDSGKAAAEKLAATERVLADTQAKLAKWEKDKKDASDKDRASKGEQEKLLAEKAAELEATTAQLKAFEKSTKERADKLLLKLPDDRKAKVEKWKDKLSLADWTSMIEDEMSTPEDKGDDDDDRPRVPGGTPSGGGGGKGNGVRELNPKSADILDQLGINTQHGQQALAKPKGGGNVHFVATIKHMIQGMRDASRGGRPWTADEAGKGRKGG